ncbi:hypothetical protein MOQ_007649, partial [Trypanosoma cruzi marinkellei]
MPRPRTTHTAPQCRIAGGVAVLEEVRRRNCASVRVAVLALQRIQQKRARRQLVQKVRPLLPRRLVLRSTVCIFRGPLSCCIHSHRETRNSVCMCAESTANVIGRGHRGAVRHASAHTEQHPHTGKQNRGERRMNPRAAMPSCMVGIVWPRQLASSGVQRASHTHPSDGTVIPTAGTHAAASPCPQANDTPLPKHSCKTLCKYLRVCLCVLKRQKRGKKGTSARQEAQLDSSGTCGTAPTSTITHGGSTHPSTKKTKERKTRTAGCGLCVCGAAG